MVQLFNDSGCSAGLLMGSGDADASGSFSIAVTVAANTATTLHATATLGGETSSCVELVTYVEDSSAPAAPAFTATAPASPANNNMPKVTGTAEAGSTVSLYTDASCTVLAATGAAALFSDPGIAVAVADNTTTIIQARAHDRAGNGSICSETAVTYVEDSFVAAPSVPDLSGPSDTGESDVDNITSDNSPVFVGTAEPGSLVEVLAGDRQVGQARANSLGDYSVTSEDLSQGVHGISARATDIAGNSSVLSGRLLVEIDLTVPVAEGRYNTNRISPNGDGQLDILAVSAAFTKTLSWSFEVRNAAGDRRYETYGKATSMAATWNGRYAGVVVPDGLYHWEIRGTDAAGNQLDLLVGSVLVDRAKPGIGGVSVWPNPFKRRQQTTTLSFSVSEAATVSVWVVDAAGSRLKTLTTKKLSSRGTMKVVWDGRNALGRFVRVGDYRLVISATDLARNKSMRQASVTVR